jgi:hypothetical protein
MNSFTRKLFALATLFWLGLQSSLLACPSCRIELDHPMANAADASVILLAVIAYTVIGGLLSFFGYLFYRSRNPLPDHQKLMEEGEKTPECDIWG